MNIEFTHNLVTDWLTLEFELYTQSSIWLVVKWIIVINEIMNLGDLYCLDL